MVLGFSLSSKSGNKKSHHNDNRRTEGTLNIDVNRLKVNLKLTIERTKVIISQTKAQQSLARKAVADALAGGRTDSARIKAEQIIRDDQLCEALDIVSTFCEVLGSRLGLLQTAVECEASLQSTVASLIWAAPRTEVPELRTLSELLRQRFGPGFWSACAAQDCPWVHAKLRQKLALEAPPEDLLVSYLEVIADAYGVSMGGNDASTNDKSSNDAGHKDESADSVDSDDGEGLGSSKGNRKSTGSGSSDDSDDIFKRLDALKSRW